MKIWPAVLMMFLIIGLVFVSGCAKKTTEEKNETTQPPVNETVEEEEEEEPEPVVIPAEEEAISGPEFEDTDTDFGDLI